MSISMYEGQEQGSGQRQMQMSGDELQNITAEQLSDMYKVGTIDGVITGRNDTFRIATGGTVTELE
jgi:hypothetical protein